MLNFFQKKMNKKGFTLIELIIVIAILAILVALLAPNVIKYLEKSRVSKDRNALDAVYTVLKAELMDENIYGIHSNAKFISLADLKATTLTNGWKVLSDHLFDGTNPALDDTYATTNIFGAKVAKGGEVYICVQENANSTCGVIGVNTEKKIIEYDDAAYYCGNLTSAITVAGETDITSVIATPADDLK